MTRDLQAQLKTTEAELESLRARAMAYRETLIPLIADFLRRWYEKQARELAGNEPETTRSLQNRLSDCKARVAELVARVEPNVRAALEGDDLWWPETWIRAKGKKGWTEQGPHEVIEEILRKLMSEIAVTFADFGYLKDLRKRERSGTVTRSRGTPTRSTCRSQRSAT